jgi:hypothetical protein
MLEYYTPAFCDSPVRIQSLRNAGSRQLPDRRKEAQGRIISADCGGYSIKVSMVPDLRASPGQVDTQRLLALSTFQAQILLHASCLSYSYMKGYAARTAPVTARIHYHDSVFSPLDMAVRDRYHAAGFKQCMQEYEMV